MRVARRLVLILLFVAAAGPAPAAAPDAYAGTWVRTEHQRDDASRAAEIERVTESVSFVFRGVARAVMRRRMRPAERYVIESSGETLSIHSDSGSVYPVDGRPRTGADEQMVTSQWADGEVLQSWTHGEGSHGTTVWRIDESGRLSVGETVYDSHFNGPLQYSNTYRRLEME